MKVLVNRMPDKKEECLFYRKVKICSHDGRVIDKNICNINNKQCTFRKESIHVRCRCLKVGLDI